MSDLHPIWHQLIFRVQLHGVAPLQPFKQAITIQYYRHALLHGRPVSVDYYRLFIIYYCHVLLHGLFLRSFPYS